MGIKELSEVISKLGTFGTSAVILTLIAAIPLVIAIDDRYAKEKALQEQMQETNKRLEEQVIQLQTINGQLQVLLTVVLPSRSTAKLPTLPELPVQAAEAPTAVPAITPEQQKVIDAHKPKEVVIQLLKNKAIQTDEKLKQTLESVRK